jgi:hypothetical protein
MMRMEIINRGSMLKKQEVGVDNKMNTLNKIQVKGKLDMFKSREMLLKVPNLIKKDINRSKRVLINNKNLINLIAGDKIEVDNNTVEAMKVVVEAMKVVVVAMKVVAEALNVVAVAMKVVVVAMKVVVEAIRILIVATNNTKTTGK